MTQEHKQLLLKDLCARLPYGVKVRNVKNNFDINNFNHNVEEIKILIEEYNIKPYLRSMSSMTEEEKEEESDLWNEHDTNLIRGMLGFYCSHHLDWNNLIPIGLALEAPKDMYKIE